MCKTLFFSSILTAYFYKDILLGNTGSFFDRAGEMETHYRALDDANQDVAGQVEDQGKIRKAEVQDIDKVLENQRNGTGLQGQGGEGKSANRGVAGGNDEKAGAGGIENLCGAEELEGDMIFHFLIVLQHNETKVLLFIVQFYATIKSIHE